MEQLDIFDEHFHHTGTASIDQVHQQGLWHQTFACWLFHPQTKVIYLQLRGPHNRVGANTFDATASGHLSAGETKENGFREVWEETGLTLSAREAVYLGVYHNIAQFSHYINREFCHIYIAPTNKNLTDFKTQTGEVSDIFALMLSDCDKLLNGKTVVVSSLHQKQTITRQNLCLSDLRIQNEYYKHVFDAIRDYINKK